MVIGKPSALVYPSTFRRMAIESQINAFQRLVSGKLNDRPLLKNSCIFVELPAYPGSHQALDNWFVIPKPWVVAKTLPKATALMARAIEVDPRSFLEGHPLGKMERWERTEEALEIFSENQKGDFWVIPAQLGFFCRGESPESSIEKMPANEFGFDLYLSLAAIVSHRGRLNGGDNELGISCTGNKNLDDRIYPKVPCLNSYQGSIRCLLNRTGEPNPNYGAATGFSIVRPF